MFFIIFLYSPIHTELKKTIDGEYVRFKTEEHEEERDKVVIHVDGEIQREHRFSKENISFIGNVWFEFEKNPDRNFKMGRDQLLFTRAVNDKNLYVYSVNSDAKMYDYVSTIYWDKGENGYQIRMYLREDWETWENWLFQEEDRKDELMENGQRTSDAVINAIFE